MLKNHRKQACMQFVSLSDTEDVCPRQKARLLLDRLYELFELSLSRAKHLITKSSDQSLIRRSRIRISLSNFDQYAQMICPAQTEQLTRKKKTLKKTSQVRKWLTADWLTG